MKPASPFKSSLLLAILLASFPIDARADYYDGNQLHSVCSIQSPVADGLCRGYIFRAFDGFERSRIVASIGRCVTRNVDGQQMVDVVKKYLVDHPAGRDFMAADIVARAVRGAFCPN